MKDFESLQKGNRGINWLQLAIAFVLLFITTLCLKIFFLGFYRVNSSSMNPTLQIGDMVLVDKFFFKQQKLKKNEIVYFHQNNSNRDLVKRIIAFEGDTVLYLNDNIFINNYEYISKDEFDSSWLPNYHKIIVPKDNVFVIGDNLNVSSDSRDWGTVNIHNILGKIVYIYFSKDDDSFHFDRIGNNLN